jgi:AsmA protein
MKILKILLVTVFSLLLLVIVAAIAIPLLIDPNDYKQQIEQQVKEQTGRELKIIGDINVSLTLSPSYLPTSLSFELGKTELSNPSDFSKDTNNLFAKINKVSINAAIMPLLQENRLEIGKVVLDQANIFLLINKQGQNNWESFSAVDSSAKDHTTKASSTKDSSVDTNSKSTQTMPEIQIAGVEIKDSIISFDDNSSGQHITLDKFKLTVSELKENKPIDLNYSTHFILSSADPKKKEQNLTGDFSIQTRATINIKQQNFQLNNTTFDLSVAGAAIPSGKNHTQLSGNIILDLAKQVLTIEKMNLDTYQLNLKGNLNVSDLLMNPKFKSHFELAQFSPKELMKVLNIDIPKMKNPKVLNTAKMTMQLTGDSNQLNLTSLDVTLDEIIIKGEASIINLKQPAYQVKLDINKLHLDDYALLVDKPAATVPGAAKNKAETAHKNSKTKTQAKTQLQSQPLIPVELIKSLNVNGQLKIGELFSNNVKMRKIVLTINSKNGVLTLDPVQSDFYKGKLQLKSTIDVRKKIPKISLQQNFTQIDLGELLFDATATKEFTGTANISSQLTTSGNYQEELLKNSNGQGKFLITDGHIAKLDIIHSLRKAHSLFYGKPVPTEKQQENTSFSELKGSVKIKNGVVHNKDLFSKSPVMQLTGTGYADLPKQYLDYTLKVSLLNSLQIDKDTEATDYRGKEIPYTIKGKFSELSKKANVKDILKQKVKAEAKKQLKKQVNKQLKGDSAKKIEEKIGTENLNKLKGLFNF